MQPGFHTTGVHYINADTTASMKFITADLFKDIPKLRLIIPHGGGVAPYHWGRYRGLAQNLNRPPLDETMRNNVSFDTCVYHQPGIDLLVKLVPAEQHSLRLRDAGRVKGNHPTTGSPYDDTRRYIDEVVAQRRGQTEDLRGQRVKVFARLKSKLRRPGRPGNRSTRLPPALHSFHPNPSKPRFQVPAGAVDAQCHVFGPASRFPYVRERKYTPVDAPKESRSVRDYLGFDKTSLSRRAVTTRKTPR